MASILCGDCNVFIDSLSESGAVLTPPHIKCKDDVKIVMKVATGLFRMERKIKDLKKAENDIKDFARKLEEFATKSNLPDCDSGCDGCRYHGEDDCWNNHGISLRISLEHGPYASISKPLILGRGECEEVVDRLREEMNRLMSSLEMVEMPTGIPRKLASPIC